MERVRDGSLIIGGSSWSMGVALCSIPCSRKGWISLQLSSVLVARFPASSSSSSEFGHAAPRVAVLVNGGDPGSGAASKVAATLSSAFVCASLMMSIRSLAVTPLSTFMANGWPGTRPGTRSSFLPSPIPGSSALSSRKLAWLRSNRGADGQFDGGRRNWLLGEPSGVREADLVSSGQSNSLDAEPGAPGAAHPSLSFASYMAYLGYAPGIQGGSERSGATN